MKAVDMKGREIKAGDTIVYALTKGRSANLAIYMVDEVRIEKDYSGKDFAKLKATKLHESYPGFITNSPQRPATLAMADARALVINETAKVWA
jgi:hypothetical protein